MKTDSLLDRGSCLMTAHEQTRRNIKFKEEETRPPSVWTS
jgi:hypothetical protein